LSHPRALLTFIAALSLTAACKKNVDPTAFDAGAAVAPVVTAAAPSAPVAAPSASDTAPLATLDPAKAPPPTPKGAATSKVNKNLPECEQARKFCNHPAHAKDKAIQDLCTKHKQSCFAKGGAL